jgi:hypothetical protein
MKRIISVEAGRGIPKLKIEEERVCGEGQIGKQTKMSHQKIKHDTTSKVLELLHMDLMGPMQVESLGGKRYAYVVVDDFSNNTWVNFIRENLMCLMCSKTFAKDFKEKERVMSSESEVIMGKNLKTINLLISVHLKGLDMSSLLPLSLSKMIWWKGKIELSKNLLEL